MGQMGKIWMKSISDRTNCMCKGLRQARVCILQDQKEAGCYGWSPVSDHKREWKEGRWVSKWDPSSRAV